MIHKTHERKAVTCSYDADEVQGKHASLLASTPDGDWEEKKQINNTGHFGLSFPADYEGECNVKVIGSAGGSDEGTIEV